MSDKLLTPRLMYGAVLRQKFSTCEHLNIESIDISFATYKRNVTSPLRMFIVNNENAVVFKTSLNRFNDNEYTNILADFSLLAGTYVLVLISDVQDTFNAVSVWYNKTEGINLMFNDKLHENSSIDFRLNEKKNGNTFSNIAVNVESVHAKKRGRPKKV